MPFRTLSDPKDDRDITSLLHVWSDGEDQAFERLIPLVYDELHRMALRYLAGERSNVDTPTDGACQRSLPSIARLGSGSLAEPRPLLWRLCADDAPRAGRHRETASRGTPRRGGRGSGAAGRHRCAGTRA